MRNIFKRKTKQIEVIEESTIEYRIREVKFDDNRTEYFPEVKYSRNKKYGIEWQGVGSYQIMFNKGYNTIEEAETALDKRKKRDKNPTGIIDETIHYR